MSGSVSQEAFCFLLILGKIQCNLTVVKVDFCSLCVEYCWLKLLAAETPSVIFLLFSLCEEQYVYSRWA